jgi:hypothetical protein
MKAPAGTEASTPPLVDIDANGVDRAQIRAMLDLTPEERLQKVEDFARGLALIRDRNAGRPLR